MDNSDNTEDILHATLKPIFYCLTIFGYYRPKCDSRILARIYDCYSLFSVGWCVFALGVFVLELRHVKGTDVMSVLIIAGGLWHTQAIFSALFAIFVFKSGKIDEIFKLWKTADLDKVIQRTRVLRVWKYLAVVFSMAFIFCCSLPIEIGYFTNSIGPSSDAIFQYGIVVEIIQHTFTRAALCLPGLIYFLLGAIYGTTIHGLKKDIENNTQRLCQITCGLTEKHFQISMMINKTDRMFRFFVAFILGVGVPTTILLIYSAFMNYDSSAKEIPYLEIQVIIWSLSQVVQMLMLLMSAAYINHYAIQLYDALYDQYITYSKSTSEMMAAVYLAKGKKPPLEKMDTETSLLMTPLDDAPMEHDELTGRLMVVQQINILLNRLANSKLGFTVWDLFVVTRGSIVTTISLVVSYFFLLLQFMVPSCGDCICHAGGNHTI